MNKNTADAISRAEVEEVFAGYCFTTQRLAKIQSCNQAFKGWSLESQVSPVDLAWVS